LRRRILELEAEARPLEPDASRREELRQAVVGASERFQRSLATRKVFEEAGDEATGLLCEPFREGGLPIEAVIEVLEHHVIRPGGHPAAAGHLAYFSGGGLYHSALADYLAAVTNKYAGLFFTGPGPVRMENRVLRWVADLVGYPSGPVVASSPGAAWATLRRSPRRATPTAYSPPTSPRPSCT